MSCDRPQGSVFCSQSGSYRLLERIANKWAVLVLVALAQGTCRYCGLKRQITGISQKMLTQTLRQLEQDGLIHRQVYATVPLRVEYSLTSLGRSLLPILQALCHWADVHWQTIEKIHKHDQPQD
jgi:DNA-binding HxlR family transcriptional regulator